MVAYHGLVYCLVSYVGCNNNAIIFQSIYNKPCLASIWNQTNAETSDYRERKTRNQTNMYTRKHSPWSLIIIPIQTNLFTHLQIPGHNNTPLQDPDVNLKPDNPIHHYNSCICKNEQNRVEEGNMLDSGMSLSSISEFYYTINLWNIRALNALNLCIICSIKTPEATKAILTYAYSLSSLYQGLNWNSRALN